MGKRRHNHIEMESLQSLLGTGDRQTQRCSPVCKSLTLLIISCTIFMISIGSYIYSQECFIKTDCDVTTVGDIANKNIWFINWHEFTFDCEFTDLYRVKHHVSDILVSKQHDFTDIQISESLNIWYSEHDPSFYIFININDQHLMIAWISIIILSGFYSVYRFIRLKKVITM